MAVDDEDDEYKAIEPHVMEVGQRSLAAKLTAFTKSFRREIHQVLVLFLLFLLNIGYGYVENLVFAMPELTKSKSAGGMGLTISEGSIVTAIADIGYVLGLFFSGPLADRFGGKRVLIITLFGSSVFNILCGIFDGVVALTIFYTLSMLCSAAAWPTSTTIIGNWFELDRQGRAFSVLSITWEIQYIITSLNLGLLLDFTGMGWRGLFVYSGSVSLVLCVVGFVFLHDTPPPDLAPPDSPLAAVDTVQPQENYLSSSGGADGNASTYSVDYSLFDENHVQLRQPSNFCGSRTDDDDGGGSGSGSAEHAGSNSDDISHLEPLDALFKMVTSWHFWWMFFLMAFLTFAYEFTEWAPKFITDTIDTDSGNAAILSASAHLSALLSLLFGGVLVDKLSWTTGSVYLVISTGCATVLAAFLTTGTFYGFSTWWTLALQQFCFGLAFTTPYYLPVSVYATRFGGTRYCATLAGFFDGFGYAVAILMDLTAGPLAENFSWSLVLIIVTFCCGISTILMAVYQHSARPKYPFRLSDYT